MWHSLLIGIGLIVSIVLVWVLVQVLWKDAFREEYREDDVLAGRRSCSNCGCTTQCGKKERELRKPNPNLVFRELNND
ncbi:hypothetical protein E7Z59_12550 [Robertkochia marina]|uniref:Uncharacterized protein n=1 Tax=Robertkochia marina TaxID=1227945 RepID=A0A4V3UXZ4_9FLAO|nr:hypothetical protein [Robertkochia marina]THD66614.1 hypothetical protein E7Z59_12550 [Robertkochia marina]TRZ45548.1 hypothetical protein D3A96_06080 [Robertkochia marina]